MPTLIELFTTIFSLSIEVVVKKAEQNRLSLFFIRPIGNRLSKLGQIGTQSHFVFHYSKIILDIEQMFNSLSDCQCVSLTSGE